MGNREKEKTNKQVIQFLTVNSSVTITFSQEESVDVKAMILDILTEAYRERTQKVLPYDKAG